MSEQVQASNVPSSLLEYDQWVCWREETRGDKETKIPINPHSGQYASTTNPDTWGDFETAHETAAKMDGLGFVFTEDDPLVGVDLDDCRDPDTGAPADWAKDVIGTLDSFTEVSPSGSGYHVLCEGELPGDRSRKDDLEMYETGRFFTVTLDHVDGTPTAIESREEALEGVYADYILETSQDTSSLEQAEQSTSGSLSDDALLEKAKSAANGASFAQLYRGSTSGYESHSEADMALCSHLAFWTGGDARQMDRLFRDSGLMRGKWDEQHFADGSTYGEKTIERAIAGTREFYEPSEASSEDTSQRPGKDDGQSTSTSVDANARLVSGGSGPEQSNDDSEGPALRKRELERMERLDELETQLRAVIDEKETLEAELNAERERRREAEERDTTTDTSWTALLPWRDA